MTSHSRDTVAAAATTPAGGENAEVPSHLGVELRMAHFTSGRSGFKPAGVPASGDEPQLGASPPRPLVDGQLGKCLRMAHPSSGRSGFQVAEAPDAVLREEAAAEYQARLAQDREREAAQAETHAARIAEKRAQIAERQRKKKVAAAPAGKGEDEQR
jgi:hypothetical protein